MLSAALFLEITPGDAQGTFGGARNRSRTGCMQGKAFLLHTQERGSGPTLWSWCSLPRRWDVLRFLSSAETLFPYPLPLLCVFSWLLIPSFLLFAFCVRGVWRLFVVCFVASSQLPGDHSVLRVPRDLPVLASQKILISGLRVPGVMPLCPR